MFDWVLETPQQIKLDFSLPWFLRKVILTWLNIKRQWVKLITVEYKNTVKSKNLFK